MSVTHLHVRLARPADVRRLGFLYSQLLGSSNHQVLPERILDLQGGANGALLVAEADGVVCGTVLVSLCADVMYGMQPFAVLENLVVDREFRQRGVGAALLKEAEAFCCQRQCSKIMILSSRERPGAHRFFESRGFDGLAKVGFVKYRRHFETDPR